MAVHDYVIANGTGQAVRQDLNNALAAIVSNNSGSSEPGTTYAYQWWADTNANVLKLRNSSNDGWVTLRELDGTMLLEDGSASTPGLAFADDVNTGIFSPAADQIGFATGGAERLEIGSSEVVFNDPSNDVDFRVESNGNTHMLFVDAGNDRVGIGASSPEDPLHIKSNSGAIRLENTVVSNNDSTISYDDTDLAIHVDPNNVRGSSTITFSSDGNERARIDSSGRLLAGTSSTSAVVRAVFEATSGGSGGGTVLISRGTNTPTLNQTLGEIYFADSGHDQSAVIAARRDSGTWTSGSSQPTYLRFDTTADGASSPTERMRISSNGDVLINTTTSSIVDQGHEFRNLGFAAHTVSGGVSLRVNRLTNDGEVVQIFQDSTQEGSISVSGTTVSYNGAHISRWSQLASGAARTEILRGSVLSNLDEMCEWAHAAQDAVLYTAEDELPEGASVGDVKTPAVDAYTEDNEQLNRMKVSDVEGDANVAGVFQGWDDDDDTYINDFYCAMTGDFVIRIAQGTTVANGDLLMSAGDGTAKPQDDDIVRSKTIAKVTSTTVSTTYSDGSYCVPCVLMAC